MVRWRCCYGSRGLRDAIARREPRVKECRWPLRAEKGKETDSLLEPPESTTFAETLILA